MKAYMSYVTRFARPDEWEQAMGLAWKTFLEFEAAEYTTQGVKSFEDFITDPELKHMFLLGTYQMITAYDQGRMVGMITLRNETHISLLFVDKEYHRKGIGRGLVNNMADYVCHELGQDHLTVNAAPYGRKFYHRVGFSDLGPETCRDGIIYTPMEKIL